jgi:hypothetical protein
LNKFSALYQTAEYTQQDYSLPINPLGPHTTNLHGKYSIASKDSRLNTLDEGIYEPIRVREETEGAA